MIIIVITGVATLAVALVSFTASYTPRLEFAAPWLLLSSVACEATGGVFFNAEGVAYANFVFGLMAVVQVLPFFVFVLGNVWLRFAHKRAEKELESAKVRGSSRGRSVPVPVPVPVPVFVFGGRSGRCRCCGLSGWGSRHVSSFVLLVVRVLPHVRVVDCSRSSAMRL